MEIGTELGRFTNFISKGFKSSKIYTIDLNENQLPKDPSFKENNISRNDFVRERSINLNEENINFIEMNSLDLLKHFDKNKFDIIWLDGDHANPQVSMDVLSTYYLLKKNGILITDDIYLNQNDSDNFLSQGFQPIKYLTDIKKLKTFYFNKKITRRNSFAKTKKFISFSIKI